MIVLMSASQFYTQRQLMTKNVDLTVKTPFMQQQKMLMYVFPIMFAVFGINFPVGVLVYWLTTNVWTMGQQMFVIRRNPTPGSQAFQQRQERLRAQGKLDGGPGRGRGEEGRRGARRANRQQPKRQEVQAPHGRPPRCRRPAAASARRKPDARRRGPPTRTGSSSLDDEAPQRQQAQDAEGRHAGRGQLRVRVTQAKSGQRKGQQRPKHPSKK